MENVNSNIADTVAPVAPVDAPDTGTVPVFKRSPLLELYTVAKQFAGTAGLLTQALRRSAYEIAQDNIGFAETPDQWKAIRKLAGELIAERWADAATTYKADAECARVYFNDAKCAVIAYLDPETQTVVNDKPITDLKKLGKAGRAAIERVDPEAPPVPTGANDANTDADTGADDAELAAIQANNDANAEDNLKRILEALDTVKDAMTKADIITLVQTSRESLRNVISR